MRRFALAAALAALLAFSVLAGGCKGQKLDQISRILATPSDYADKDVTVAGRVSRVFDPSMGLLSLSAYQVQDNTGSIWVLSRTGAPAVGQEVGLKGRVRTDFKLGSEVFGAVLNEVERRTR